MFVTWRKRRVRNGRSVFASRVMFLFVFSWKNIFHEICQSLDGLLGVWSLCFQSELGALGRP